MAVRKIKKHSKKILVLALAFLLVGVYLTIGPIRAADVTNMKDTLSDSRPSVVSNHTVEFATPTGVDASTDTITVTFPAGFTMGSVAFGDMDLEVDAACDGTFEISKTLAATASTSPTWGAAVSGQVVTLTAPTDAASGEIAAAACVKIEIGTNADSGVNQITNNTAAVYDIVVGGAFGDSGTVKISVIAGVTVSATIAETLTFTINLQSAVNCPDNIGGTEITSGITSTAMPFGTINSDTHYFGCQVLDVDTNASDGYTTTVKQLDELDSGSAEIANGTCDGACTITTAAAWATAANNGFGYCMDDIVGDPAVTADATGWATVNQCDDAAPFFKIFPTNPGDAQTDTPEAIMSSAAAESGDQANIGYKISIGAGQAAGTYTNTMVFVTTATYD